MKKFTILASLVLILVACKDRNKDVTLNQPINLNGKLDNTSSNAGKTLVETPAANTNSALKQNPEHGAPGHRCELAVGAPLSGSAPSSPVVNSPTVSQPVSQTISQPISSITSQTPISASIPTANAKASGNLNPAHGQPGHRCDISVGAPLNSAPAKTSTEVSKPAPNVSVTPVPTVTAPGMNPQHGQPGHKCEIAVGAPLNSAPGKSDVPRKDSSSKS